MATRTHAALGCTAHPAPPTAPGTGRRVRSPARQDAAVTRVDVLRPEQRQLSLLLTCSNCRTAYEPSAEDFAFGRTSCPNPDCDRGWAWTAALTVPTPGGAR